jgi:hypothetical protein
MTSSIPKPWARLYGTTLWERRSKLQLRMFPLCAECKRQGRTQEANLSHHIEEWRPSCSEYQFWYGALESLCFTCHSIHHGFNLPKEDFERDIDASGWPCDPMHPVYQSNTAKRESSHE